jgi:asparagine synthase (glutamine-hydrolysing)
MCGIAGITWIGPHDKGLIISRALLSLRPRGPDEAGFYCDDYIGLAHTRLTIIDADNGKQPFFIQNHDEILIYNGEIFNYDELRSMLEKKGVALISQSDTELLFHLLMNFDTDAVALINGQFSFCFYQPSIKRILLARDPFGEKPLFYSTVNNQFAFASDAKTLISMLNIQPKICKTQMLSMAKTWATHPSKSIFSDINQLPPGSLLIHNENLQINIHYQNVGLNNIKGVEPRDSLANIITSSVKRRMRSDVPIGLLLSGGIDSSIIGHEMSALSNNMPIQTFSVSFKSDQFNEDLYQKIMVQSLKARHKAILFDEEMLINNLDDSIYASELPSHRMAFVAMYCLHKEIHKNDIKVVLSGEGADELFFGYDIFTETFIRNKIKQGASYESLEPYIALTNSFMVDDPGYHKMNRLKYSNYSALSKNSTWDSSHLQRASLGAKAFNLMQPAYDQLSSITSEWHEYLNTKYADFTQLDVYRKAQIIESETLLTGHLLSTQGDRVSMANSIETRMPFLDPGIANFSLSKNVEEFFFQTNQEKLCIKNLYKKKLPEQIVNRKKYPFRSPDSELLLKSKIGQEYVQYCLNELDTVSNIFDEATSKIFLRNCLDRGAILPRDNFAFNLLITTLSLQKQFNKIYKNPASIVPRRTTYQTKYGTIYEVLGWKTLTD